MVRITSGLYKGRKLRVPRAGVRPTKDMVRQALFSALGDSLVDKRMVDLFAGSGAVGLEALSRGAGEVWWVEEDARTFALLEQNVGMIDPERLSRCVRMDAFLWLKSGFAPAGLDFIFADPPYRPPEGEASWGGRLLETLASSAALKPEGLFVLEQRHDQPVVDNPGFSMLRFKEYGESMLVYYRKQSS
jgi:16S rRNA (guanine966-N2)-methyltransferase